MTNLAPRMRGDVGERIALTRAATLEFGFLFCLFFSSVRSQSPPRVEVFTGKV